MKINPKIGKSPEELASLKFSGMKAIIKKDLLRLEKNTTREKPTQIMLIAEHDYADKPKMALPILGVWKGAWKKFAKIDTVQADTGAIGRAYFDGLNPAGQKVVHIDVAKGKGKSKTAKMEKQLRKLVPQATYEVVFSEMSESELEALEQLADAAPEEEENFDAIDESDSGELEVDTQTQNYATLLNSNLQKISAAFVILRDKVKQKTAFEADEPEILSDYANEWLELYKEADANTQAAYTNRLAQVQPIKDFADKLAGNAASDAPQATASAQDLPQPTEAGADISAAALSNGREMINGDKNPQYQSGYWGFNWSNRPQDVYTGTVYKKGDKIKVEDAIFLYRFKRGAKANKSLVDTAAAQGQINQNTGAPYQIGEAVTDQQVIEVFTNLQISKPLPTWCNTFALDLSKKILGAESPFGKAFEDWKKQVKGRDQGCGDLVVFMNEKTDLFEKITEQGGKSRTELAWEAANAGKLVQFVDSGHISTAVKTDKLETRKDKAGKNWKFGKVIQAGRTVGEVYLNYVWSMDSMANVDIFITKGTGNSNPNPNPNPNPSKTISSSVQKGAKGADVITVQQLLIGLGYDLGSWGADGDAGKATDTAIRKFQSDKGLPVTGIISPESADFQVLLGKPLPLQPSGVQFKYGAGASPLNPKAEQLLRAVLAKANEANPSINSTLRTPEQQALVMYNNIIQHGAAANRSQYLNPASATKVVDAYEAALRANKTDTEVKQAVLAAVNQVGAATLSAHCNPANPAIDIETASIKDKAAFETALKAEAGLSFVLDGNVYHIEVR